MAAATDPVSALLLRDARSNVVSRRLTALLFFCRHSSARFYIREAAPRCVFMKR